ncbi:hypothetical protein GOV13_01820 [Candidatus Pacearchaeota archaeon]|nr:hypothetical protein [Candidatus Pacearchaeota archaeon]
MNRRAYLQISFAWVFALLVGAVILFLAIFASTKLINTEQTTQDAKTGKEIGILLNPLETSFESGKTTSLTLPIETRIYNKCNNQGNFGRQIIQISQKSFDKWTETDIDVGFSNKYIFSDRYVEGKKVYLFSKPFDFPFKVTDLVYMTSSLDHYCFSDAPEDVYEEISDLGQENLFTKDCPDNDIHVCFGSGGNCDVVVNYEQEYVKKGADTMYFEGDALMYGAIFSEKNVYECQVKRLMQRIENLALLYQDKAAFVSAVDCNSNLDLEGLGNSANILSNSASLGQMNNLVEDIKQKNDLAGCRLW